MDAKKLVYATDEAARLSAGIDSLWDHNALPLFDDTPDKNGEPSGQFSTLTHDNISIGTIEPYHDQVTETTIYIAIREQKPHQLLLRLNIKTASALAALLHVAIKQAKT